MKKLITNFLLFLTFAVTAVAAQGRMDEATINAGLRIFDRSLHIKDGWIRDPYIYLAPDGYYYLTGTTANPGDPREDTEPYNTGLDIPELTGSEKPSIVGCGLRLWRSQNLIEWEDLGVPFTLDQGYWALQQPERFENVPREKWRLWAPEVYFFDGRWIFVHTSPSPVGGGANLAVTQSGNFKGPFLHPMKEAMRGKHDPSLFRDEEGTFYLLWSNTWIAPLKSGKSGLAAEPLRIDHPIAVPARMANP